MQKSFANDQFTLGNSLKTENGLITVRVGSKDECIRLQGYDECNLLDWNGKPLLSEYLVSIEAAIPNKNNPKVIFASASTGGNACCTDLYLIDLTTQEPYLLEVESLPKPYGRDPAIAIFNEGFTYENFGNGKGALGEPLWNVYRYKYGSRKTEILRTVPKYSFTPIENKKYPYEIFDDPINRAPLLKITGNREFVELRSRMGTGYEIEKYTNGIYAGIGCIPHACGSGEGIFLLDVAKKQSWAIYIDDTSGKITGKFFGNLKATDVIPRQALNKWLNERKITWSQLSIYGKSGIEKDTNPIENSKLIVQMAPEGGVFKVPVTINEIIPVSFIVDSGASDVVIPEDIVNIMIKTGTLTKNDFTGTRFYKLADGKTESSKTFRIKTLRIGDRVFENIEASMTGVNGILLLGQSFLKKMQRWSINNSNHTLELE
jgi:hypothetical protein